MYKVIKLYIKFKYYKQKDSHLAAILTEIYEEIIV